MFQLPPLTPLVKKVLIAVGVSTVLVLLLTRLAGLRELFFLLALVPLPALEVLGVGPAAWVWQIITHAFVYPPEAILSAAFGLFFLYVMGAPMELRVGPKVLFRLLAVSVVASGLGGILGMLILPTKYIAGISPMLVGLIAGMAASMPLDSTVSLFGVMPMKQKTVLLTFGILIVLTSIADENYGVIVSEFAAGAAAYAYIKSVLAPKRPKPRGGKPKNGGGKRRAHGFRVIEGGSDDDEPPKYLN